MGLANLTDAEVRAVMALARLRHERRRYAEAIVDVEEAAGALPQPAQAAEIVAEIAREPQRQGETLGEVRTAAAARKAEAERMAQAQAAAKTRKVGN